MRNDTAPGTTGAIPTTYAGIQFRSRLEATWALFFDHISVKWEYEPEGFQAIAPGNYEQQARDENAPSGADMSALLSFPDTIDLVAIKKRLADTPGDAFPLRDRLYAMEGELKRTWQEQHKLLTWSVGDEVLHPRYHLGVITEVEGSGEKTDVTIEFKQWCGGIKRFAAYWTPLLPKGSRLSDYTSPIPGMTESYGTTRGILVLGPLPRIELSSKKVPAHGIVQHHKGVWMMGTNFTDGGLEDSSDCWTGNTCWDGYDDGPYELPPVLEGRVFNRPMTPQVKYAYMTARAHRWWK